MPKLTGKDWQTKHANIQTYTHMHTHTHTHILTFEGDSVVDDHGTTKDGRRVLGVGELSVKVELEAGVKVHFLVT